MFFKKKCPNCGAKNPEGLIACAICGAPFALRQTEEQLEGRKEPTPAWPKEVEKEAEEEKAEEEAEITCPKCGAVFLLRDAEEEVGCPNPKCRAVLQTAGCKERLVFKGKAEINPGSKDAEVADCYVTEGDLVVASTKPLRIPLQSLEDCYTSMPVVEYRSGQVQVGPSSVRLRYRDASGHKRIAEFQMHIGDAGSLESILSEARRRIDIKHVLCPNCRVANGDWGYCENCGSDLINGAAPERPLQGFLKPLRHYRFGAAIEADEATRSRGFFDVLRDIFRDHARDDICRGPRSFGIDAQMAPRGRAEEDIGEGSLGVIDIPEGPIRWVNVRKIVTGGGRSSTTDYYTDYGVPDSRLGPNSPEPESHQSV